MAISKQKKDQQPQFKKIPIQSQWFKNVGRSLGMTATEMIGEMAPSTIEFATSTFETVTDVYNDLRENRVNGKRVLSALNLEDQYNMGVQGLKNAMDDIKSGKIYNKERIDELYNDGDDEDFGLTDFEFDETIDDNMDSDESFESEPKVNIHQDINDNAPIVASINAQSQVIAATAEANITATKQQGANSIIFNQKHSELVMRGVNSINNNLGLLVNFYTNNMTKYIHASISYYETSLKHLNDTVEELKKLTYKDEEEPKQKDFVNKWDNNLLAYGGLDMKEYANNVKQNFYNAVDDDLILSSIKNFITDTDTLQYMLASPLSFISTKIVKSLVPNMLQSTLQMFDKTMENFFPSLLLKITGLGEKNDGNYLWDLVSKIFGVNNTVKNGIDVGNYNKGKIPFDGVTKKAITEVIPTYLKKILSVLSGKKEISYDYDKGTFKTTESMKADFTKKQNETARNGYGEVLSAVKQRSQAVQFTDTEVQEKFNKGIDEFFSSLGKSGKFINPLKDSDEDFNDIYNFNGDTNLQRFFRRIMNSLSRQELMALSKGTIDSRVNLSKYFDELEKKNDISFETLLSNGTEIDESIRKDSKGNIIGISENSPFAPKDKFNLTSLDYLRRIENILITGIRTFPNISSNSDVASNNIPYVLPYDTNHSKDEQKIDNAQVSSQSKNKTYSYDEKEKALNKGINIIDSSYDLGDDTEIDNMLNTYIQLNHDTDHEKENQQDTIFKKMAKYLPENVQSTWGNFSDIIQSIVSAPGRMLSGVVEKLDKTLFSIIFGVDENGNSHSLVDGMIATFKSKMENIVTFFSEKIFDPLHETLFGENGWFTKFKESEMFGKMKDWFGNFKDYAFGMKNAEGFRAGGLFSDTFNEFRDILSGFGYYFTGNPYKDSKGNDYGKNEDSVFSNIKDIAKDVMSSTKDYIFGTDSNSKDPNADNRPIKTIIKDSLVEGLSNFRLAIFGDDENTKEEHLAAAREFADNMKKNLPKTLAWGGVGLGAGALASVSGLGLFGSLFLPGGPIGGAVVGMGLHLLSQSDTFMDKVFGPKGSDDKRVGGIISASTQKFFKDNKNIIIGAGTLGALKPLLGLGWMPSFILPGGPIGGALMGIAAALTLRSQTFQNLMFGKEIDENGKRAGGLLSSFANAKNKLFGSKDAKTIMVNSAVGAGGGAALSLMVGQLGLLGSMLTPFGPVGGAMMGAAAGIALSSKKWTKAIFGEIDKETGKREGGILGKAGNWFEFNVLDPMKDTFDDISVKMYGWFGNSIAMPFREALFPIKTEIKYMIENVNNMFKKGWDMITQGINNTFTKFVIKPFSDFMKKHVFNKLTSVLSFAFKSTVKLLGMGLAAPFKILGQAGHIAERRQEKRGKKNYIKDLKEQRKSGNISRLDYFRQRFFDKEGMEDAKTAAKVGNATELREEAKKQGMTFGDFVKSKKKEATDKYKESLLKDYQDGKIDLREYMNSRYFNKRGMDKVEDEALGATSRNEYYEKLDRDKANFKKTLKEKEEARKVRASRNKIKRDLGFDSDYSGFIYEKDKDGNTVENGKKVSVDRIVETLSMKKSSINEKQQDIINQIGKATGVKDLLGLYTEQGLDMSSMSKKQKKNFQKTIGQGHLNDLFRSMNPYTKEEREKAFNDELVDITKIYNEKMSEKADQTNSTLSNIEDVFKEVYNMLRLKYGLKAKKFTNDHVTEDNSNDSYDKSIENSDELKTNIDSESVITPDSLADAQSQAIIPVVNKLDTLISTIDTQSSNLPLSNIMTPSNNTPVNNDVLQEVAITKDEKEEDNKSTALAIIEANNKLVAKEKMFEADEKKKELVEANQKFASRKTADFVIGENTKRKNLKSFLDNHILQSDMLTGINKAIGGMAKGFDWVFGKKGILTALFMLALPFIMDWLRNRGASNQPEDRIDKDGDYIVNAGLDKDVKLGGAKIAGIVAEKLAKSPLAKKISMFASEKFSKWAGNLSEGVLKKGTGKTTGTAAGKMTDDIMEEFFKGTSKSTDNILKPGNMVDDIFDFTKPKLLTGQSYVNWGDEAVKGTDDVAEGFGKYFNKFKYKQTTSQINKNLAEKLGTSADNIIGGAQYSLMDEYGNMILESRQAGANKLLTMMRQAFDNFVIMVSNGLKRVGNVTLGLGSLTDDVFKMIDQRIIMQKFGKMIGSGGKLALDIMAKTFTNKVFMLYGAGTGLFEAHRLFKIYKQDVDPTMALISAALKTAMAYELMFFIEMINEIIADVTDVDVFTIIATHFYKAISSDEKDIALESAQFDFQTGLKTYNEKNGTSLSMDAFSDLNSKFLSTDIFDESSAVNHRIDENVAVASSKWLKGGMKATLKSANEAFLQDGEKAVIEGAQHGWQKYVANSAKTIGKGLDKLPFAKSLRSFASASGTLAKVTVKSITDVVNEIDLKRMNKFRSLVDDALGKISNAFGKQFPALLGKVDGALRKAMLSLSDDILAKFMPKIAEKLSQKITGMAVGAATGFVWSALEFTAGAISGSTTRGAASLFRVDQDSVDGLMRGVSAVITGLMNVSWFFVIDILNDIYVAVTDTDFLTFIAGIVYDLLATEQQSIELDGEQIEFEQMTKEYNQEHGTNLSVDEYNDEVANASWWTRMKNSISAKKALREKAKAAGISVKEYQEQEANKAKQAANSQGMTPNLGTAEQQQQEIIKSTDENMSELRSILTSTMENMNTVAEDQLAPTVGITEEQLTKVKTVIEGTMTGIDDATRTKMEASLGVSGEALDGVYGTMKATMFGLDAATLDSMAPIMDISEEKLSNIKKIVYETMNGMDKSTVENMYESGEITKEQMENIYTVMDATMNGMNEETLDNIAPLLGISQENLGAVKKLINETMTDINGETEKNMTTISVSDQLANAKTNIQDGIGAVETESKSWKDTLLENISSWWSNIWDGRKEQTPVDFGGKGGEDPEVYVKNNPIEDLTKIGQSSLNKAGTWISDKASALGQKASDAGQWVSDKSSNLMSKGQNALSNTGSWLSDKASALGQKASEATSWISKAWQGDTKYNDLNVVEEKSFDLLGSILTPLGLNSDTTSSTLKAGADISAGINKKLSEIPQHIIKTIFDSFGDIGKTVTDTFVTPIFDSLINIKDDIWKQLKEVFDPLADIFSGLGEDFDIIKKGADLFIGDFKNKFNEVTTKIEDNLKIGVDHFNENAIEPLKEGFKIAGDNLKIGVDHFNTTVVGPFKEGFKIAGDNLKIGVDHFNTNVVGPFKEGFEKAGDNLKIGVDHFNENVIDPFKDTMKKISNNIKKGFNKVKTSVTDNFVEPTIETLDKFKTTINDGYSDFKENIIDKVSDWVDGTKKKITTIKDTVVNIFDAIGKVVKDKFVEPTLKGIETGISDIVDYILTPFKWASDKLNNGWNSFVDIFKQRIEQEGGRGEIGGRGESPNDILPIKENTPQLNKYGEVNLTGTPNMENPETKSMKTSQDYRNNAISYDQGGFGKYEEQNPVVLDTTQPTKLAPGTKVIPMGGGKPISPTTPKMRDGGKGVEPETINNFAYYAQTDDRYKNHSYDLSPGLGHDPQPSLQARGCGPTSMAMVATQLTGKKYLPTTVADMSRSWGTSVSAGTSWSFFPKAANAFSMNVQNKDASATGLRSAISSGQPVILSGQRTTYAREDSPFTPGGHFVVAVGTQGNSKVLINDPRGSGESKAYDINKVVNEAANTWQFKYNAGGTLPKPDGNYSPTSTSNNNTSSAGTSTNTSTTEPEKLDTWGALGKFAEAIGIYADGVIGGATKLDFNKNNSTLGLSPSANNTNGGNTSTEFMPTTVQDAILKKTLELTIQHETGGNYTRVKNDTTGNGVEISPSLGIIQWRGNNAKTLMQNIYKKLPNNSEAQYWANYDWGNDSPWGSGQRQRLENFFSSNLNVTKSVQDSMAMDYIKKNNLSQVYKYGVDIGKIKDPRAIVHLAEIGNTGPALISDFLSNYTKNTSGDEFEHYINQFNSKSYWGGRSVYQNRLRESYNSLKNWTPQQMIDGGKGGEEVTELFNNLFGEGSLELDPMFNKVNGGKGGDDKDKISNSTIDKMVEDLMKSVKSKDFDSDSLSQSKIDNPDIVFSPESQNSIDTMIKDINKPEPQPEMTFDPDLSSINNLGGKGNCDSCATDLGGKGGETEILEDKALTSRESSVTPTVVEPAVSETPNEIKELNNSVVNMTDKIIAKTPTLLSNNKETSSSISTINKDNPLLIEIISILKGIETNTGSTSIGINSLTQKELSVNLKNEITVEKDDEGNIIAINNNNNNTVNPMFKTNTKTSTDVKYANAKNIAKGRINK